MLFWIIFALYRSTNFNGDHVSSRLIGWFMILSIQVHLGSEEIVAFLLLLSSFDELSQIGKEISDSGKRTTRLSLSNHESI